MTISLVQPYDPMWPSHFQQLKSFLESAMSDVECVIEHVGSTAVPGMMAKPIIDIVVVIVAGSLLQVKEQLQTLGYVHQGDLGIPKREAFKLVDAKAKHRLPEHHLYVCEQSVHELRKQLAFRDFMRQHSEWRERLNCLKRELCLKHDNDRQSYIDGKADMIEEITRLALESSEQGVGD